MSTEIATLLVGGGAPEARRRGRWPGTLRQLLFFLSVVLGCASLAAAASWDEVLGRYQACRQRFGEVDVQLGEVDAELAQLDRQLGLADEGTRNELQGFSKDLRERGGYTRDALRRVPALIEGIEREIENYRDSRSCPECIDSSTRLLCATVTELTTDVEGCRKAARDLRAFLSGELAAESLVAECQTRWSEVRSAFLARKEFPEVEEELRAAAVVLADSRAALRGGKPARAVMQALKARQDLARLATYLETPP